MKVRNVKVVSELTKLLKAGGFVSYIIPLIISQFAYETGNFESKVFKENNNPSGMKFPKIRKTTAKGTVNNHAFYENLSDAVKDYKLYFEFTKIPQIPYTVNGFVEMLKNRGYFEDSLENYQKGVNYFYNLYY